MAGRRASMVRLSDLVATIARVEGLPEPGVAQIARHVREAGLVSQSGRGLSAARMTIPDAANLLIAVNAAPMAKDAPRAVARYRGMVNYMRSPDPDSLGDNAI